MIIFASDLDGTLLGNKDSLNEFTAYITNLRSKEYPIKLVYATGRSLEMYTKVATDQDLPKPDALILAVGTEIYINGELDTDWRTRVGNLNLPILRKVCESSGKLKLQPKEDQRDYKLSYFCNNSLIYKEIKQKVKKYPVDVLYSHNLYLDILPKEINKGSAVQYLSNKWGATQIICAGDSGNDIDMLRIGRAIIVSNAKPELLEILPTFTNTYYMAKQEIAAGVVEGLRHYLKN